MKGVVRITHFRRGRVVSCQRVRNLFVTSGATHVAGLLGNPSGTAAMSHMAIGDDNTAAAIGDVALVNEKQRIALTSVTRAGNVVTYSTTFTNPGTSLQIKEAGIFNAAAAGTMLSRAIFAVTVDYNVGDTLKVDWDVTV